MGSKLSSTWRNRFFKSTPKTTPVPEVVNGFLKTPQDYFILSFAQVLNRQYPELKSTISYEDVPSDPYMTCKARVSREDVLVRLDYHTRGKFTSGEMLRIFAQGDPFSLLFTNQDWKRRAKYVLMTDQLINYERGTLVFPDDGLY